MAKQQKKPKTTVFDDLARGAWRQDYLPRTIEAQNYYKRKARSLGNLTPTKLLRDADSDFVADEVRNSRKVIGNMIMYKYDPKTKKELPYYDVHPLIFILKPLKDGFLGMNFHYLPHRQRAFLLNRLMDLASNKRFDEMTRLKISYDLLNSSARYKAFKPTVKRYLNSHVKSRFLQIPSYDWEIAIFLPVQKFVGASQQKVWADSRKKYS